MINKVQIVIETKQSFNSAKAYKKKEIANNHKDARIQSIDFRYLNASNEKIS